MEYNNSVWAPYRKLDIDKLEKVQKRIVVTLVKHIDWERKKKGSVDHYWSDLTRMKRRGL